VLLRHLPDVAEPLVAGRCQVQRVVPAIPPVASGERGLAMNLQSKGRSRCRTARRRRARPRLRTWAATLAARGAPPVIVVRLVSATRRTTVPW